MKILKYNKIGIVVVMALLCSGCSDFLQFEPYGAPTSDNFWKTEDDLRSALNAFHAFTYEEGVTGRGITWFVNCSDDMVTGRTQAEADQIKSFQMSASNGRDARDTWPHMYRLIAKTNDVLRYAPEMQVSAALKSRAIAESRFYRAFGYLWLAPWYGDNGPNGGIPIVTELTPVDELDAPRPASVLENYDMIIEDMRAAGEELPYFSQLAKTEYGRPHKAAAWAFAARAALYAAQYNNAYYDQVIELCDKIINMTGADKRGLYPSFADLFTMERNFCEEYIFSLLGNAVEGPKYHGMSFQNGGFGVYNTWGYFQPTLELYEAFEPGDERRAATILYPNEKITFIGKEYIWAVDPQSVSPTSGLTFRKFMSIFEPADCIGRTVNPDGNNQSNCLGTVMIRYADIVLMKAEALIWKNGEGDAQAKILLNSIRKRAGLDENSGATKAALKNERRCELVFEFLTSRHLDLVRWGDAQAVYAKPLHGVNTILNDGVFERTEVIEIFSARTFNPSIHHVFPIPSNEIAKSKNLTQNNGY